MAVKGFMQLWAISAIASGLITGAVAFWGGWKLSDARHQVYVAKVEQEHAAALAEQAQEARRQADRAKTLSEQNAALQARLRAAARQTTREVIREVVKPEYRCELPDAGRRLLDDAAAAANAAAAGRPDDPVRAGSGAGGD